jgi:hypothetical protein
MDSEKLKGARAVWGHNLAFVGAPCASIIAVVFARPPGRAAQEPAMVNLRERPPVLSLGVGEGDLTVSLQQEL